MIAISAGYTVNEYSTLIAALNTSVITPTKAGFIFAELEMFK